MSRDRGEVLVGAEEFDAGGDAGLGDDAVDRAPHGDALAAQPAEQTGDDDVPVTVEREPLDLLIIVDPEFGNAVQGRTEKVIEGQRLSIISVDALVALKRLRNSNRDLGDLDALRDAGLTRD